MNINLKYLYLGTFTLFIILDHLIMNLYLGYKTKIYFEKFKNLPTPIFLLIIFSIVFTFLSFLNWFGFDTTVIGLNLDSIYNIHNVMGDGGNDNQFNLHKPEVNVNVNIPSPSNQSLNNAVSGATSVGSAYVAHKVVQHYPGSPVVKAAAGVAIYSTVLAGSYVLGKSLNSKNSPTSNPSSESSNLNNFLPGKETFELIKDIDYTYPLNIFNSPVLIEKYPDFPLNMLSEIYVFNNLELFWFFIILNTSLVEYFIKIDFNKYVPKNIKGSRSEKILFFLINKYINTWNKYKNILRFISVFMLFFCIIFSKLAFYFIINN